MSDIREKITCKLHGEMYGYCSECIRLGLDHTANVVKVPADISEKHLAAARKLHKHINFHPLTRDEVAAILAQFLPAHADRSALEGIHKQLTALSGSAYIAKTSPEISEWDAAAWYERISKLTLDVREMLEAVPVHAEPKRFRVVAGEKTMNAEVPYKLVVWQEGKQSPLTIEELSAVLNAAHAEGQGERQDGPHSPLPWELDSAKDGQSVYYIIHAQTPKGLKDDSYGYPVVDTMNRHFCISPEEDKANAELIVKAVNAYHAAQSLTPVEAKPEPQQERCPQCSSNDKKVRKTGRLGAMDTARCNHPWHSADAPKAGGGE